MSIRKVASLVAFLGVAACSQLFPDNSRVMTGNIVMKRDVANLQTVIPAPFATVIDSAILRITPDSGSAQRIARHLGLMDTVVSLPFSVAPGNAKFAIEIRSNNNTLLFTADTTANIDRDGFSVSTTVKAVAPVFAASPDSVTTFTTVVLGNTVRTAATVTLYDRGLGAMDWNLTSRDAAFGAPLCNSCTVSVTSGAISASKPGTISFLFHPDSITKGRAYHFVLHSTGGDITVRFKYPN